MEGINFLVGSISRDKVAAITAAVITAVFVCLHGGDQVLASYFNHKDTIDLVITDLDMPDIDGRVLMSTLRADNPQLKIIIITGNTNEADNPNSPIYQANLWLSKPFWIDDLVNALDRIR